MDLEILKIASNTDNNKVLNNHTHYSKLKNPIKEKHQIQKNLNQNNYFIWTSIFLIKLQ